MQIRRDKDRWIRTADKDRKRQRGGGRGGSSEMGKRGGERVGEA